MNKMIWLSGSRGFVGAEVVKSLISAGYDVKCLSNSSDNQENIIYIDYSNRNQIKDTVIKYGVPDTFVHLGWGNVNQQDHSNHLTSNLQNGITLIDELYALGVARFLLIGSSNEYGNRKGELTEDLKHQGLADNYGSAKTLLAQYGFSAASRLNKIFIHVRLFVVFGANQKHNSLINQLFQSYRDGEAISLSPCEQNRDYIYVTEAAEGITKLCNVNISSLVNLGSGHIIKLKEFVKLIWKELGADPKFLLFGSHSRPTSEISQPTGFASLTNLKNLTGWSPTLKIEDGIKRTVEQLRANNLIEKT